MLKTEPGWSQKCEPTVTEINNEWILATLFEDDQLVVADNELDMSCMIRKLIEEYKKWVTEINMQKTKYEDGGTYIPNTELSNT